MREIFKGATSNIEYFMLVDSTTGLGKTGLAYTDMTGSYVRGGAARTAITMATQTASGAYSSGGFVEVDSGNCPGLYRFDIPDAAFSTGVSKVIVSLKASGTKTEHKEFRLIDWNKQVAAIPNAAAEASGGLPTLSAAQASNGTINVNVHRWLTGTPNALQSGRVDSYLGAVASGVIAAASFASGAFDAVWTVTDRQLSAFSSSFKTGYALSSAGVQAIWDALTSALSTASSIGKLLVDNVNATISSRSSHSAADVWAVGTRALTDKANFTLHSDYDAAKTAATQASVDDLPTNAELATALGGLNDLSAADVAAELATYDGPTKAELDSAVAPLALEASVQTIDTVVDSILAAVQALSIPTANQNADALLDRTNGVETSYTLRQALRLILAANAGKLSGAATTTVAIRDVGDSKDRITATTDADGNRTAVSYDVS